MRLFQGRKTLVGGHHGPAPGLHALIAFAIASIANPKTVVFFVAFLPQFVVGHHPPARSCSCSTGSGPPAAS